MAETAKKKYERRSHDEGVFEHMLAAFLELSGGKTIFVWQPKCETFEAQEKADYSLAHWLVYLSNIEEGWRAEHWAAVARDGQTPISLPCVLPHIFDSKYDLPDKLPGYRFRDVWSRRTPGKHANEQTLAERQATVEEALYEVRKAAKHMDMFPNEPRRKDEPAPAPVKTLDDLKREAVENPVKLSPELAKRLGLKKGDEPVDN